MAKVADHSAYLRGGAVQAMKEDAVVNALFDGRIFNRQPPAKPAWPWVRVESGRVDPTEASGFVGGEVPLFVHVFHQGTKASEEIDAMTRRIAALLDGAKVDLALDEGETGEKPVVVEMWWRGTDQPARDTEAADAYHGVVEFAATTAVSR